jgi:hypothetical protein
MKQFLVEPDSCLFLRQNCVIKKIKIVERLTGIEKFGFKNGGTLFCTLAYLYQLRLKKLDVTVSCTLACFWAPFIREIEYYRGFQQKKKEITLSCLPA